MKHQKSTLACHFETLKDNVRMWVKDQRDLQISKHSQNQFLRLARQNVDTKAGLSPSGGSLEEHRGERSPPRRPTVPYPYGRDSVPQERTGFHPEFTNQYPTERTRYSGDDRPQRPTSLRHSAGHSSHRSHPYYSQHRDRSSTSRHSGGDGNCPPRRDTGPYYSQYRDQPSTSSRHSGTIPRVAIPIPTTPLNTVTNPLPPHDTVAVMMEAVAVIRLPGVVITSALPGDDTNPMLVANVGKSRY